MKGWFFSFEGIDGSGKSTQIEFVREYLESIGMPVVFTREPGGTRVSEEIRRVLLDPENKEMDPVTECYLYAASRAETVRKIIRPALEAGKTVICDRYVDSSIAYQGYGRGLGDLVRRVNMEAVDGLMPDLTILLDAEPDAGRRRIEDRPLDRLEQEKTDFFRRVRDGYLDIASQEPERVREIDGMRPIEVIRDEILDLVRNRVGE